MAYNHFNKTILLFSIICSLQVKFYAQTENVERPTIQNIIDLLISEAVDKPFEKTVDVVKTGDPNDEVNGIVTTFMANVSVIEEAIKLGANFIITHEPTFYNHLDHTEWIENDKTFQYKKKLLDDNNIVVWRFHDYMHTIKPDPVVKATVKLVEWENYSDEKSNSVFNLEQQSFAQLVNYIKKKFGVKRVKVLGNPDMNCKKIGLSVGSDSGENQIKFMSKYDLDVLITGESSEYEVSEYIRDSNFSGRDRALIVLGHANTEEPGMKWLVEYLKTKLKETPIHFVPGEDSFEYR